jgi:peptidyl-prolyl isomerase E (cyclophilin E)
MPLRNDKRTLYVGGLDDTVNETLLYAAFIPFGDVVECHVPKDQEGKARGFGFVEFEDAADAAEAMFNMNGAELLGRVLNINIAKPFQQDKGNLSGAPALFPFLFCRPSFARLYFSLASCTS